MAVDAHNLGEFASISDAWKLYPNGGGFGDYITVNGVRVDWNEYSRSWGEQTETGGTTRPDEVVPHSIDVQGTGTFRDGVKVGSYVKDTSGANIDQFGNAEFRSVQLDALMVKYGNSYVPLSDFIKTFKTELPPNWTEYTEIPLFDDVRLLVFDENSSEKFYTTIGALKAVIGSGGSSGGGTVNIEIIRSDEPDKTPTDNNVFSALKVLLEIQNRSISKVNKDTAQRLIQFIEGITIGDFETGLLGSGAAIKNVNGTTIAEVDQLLVRQRAEFFSVLIHEARSVGGQLIISAANLFCTKVEEFSDFYRCYFDSKNGEVANLFANTDFARSQIFTGARQKFYWRKVIAVGTDYIELSKTNAAINSDIPEVGDTIFQLGSTDVNRQGAMILSTVGIDAPSFIQYSGIDSFSLEGKELTKFTRLGNRVSGKTVFVSSGSNLDDWATGTSQDIQDAQAAANAAALAAQQAIDDAAANVGLINTEVGKLQAQIDGEVSNWFYPYSPTLANYPASDWTTNAIKDRHIGDTFTNTQQAPATDAGKSWRFVVNAGVYSWTQIADSDAILALQKAAQAQSTADGKSTTYLIQPTSYKFGDMWVLTADQTVNGIAYKSGEILTATQDSTSYVQAHWVKKVRYTDDTAVNNLRIGVNIFNNSEAERTGQRFLEIPVRTFLEPYVGKSIVVSFDIKSTVAGRAISVYPYQNSGISIATEKTITSTLEYQRFVLKTTVKDWGQIAGMSTGSIGIYDTIGESTITVRRISISVGTAEIAWNLSDADMNVKIADAKLAGTNAQAAANAANTAVGNLNTYVEGSFKDGVIEASEAKAIEKYINIVNTEKSNLEATYNTLYTNTYLEGTPKTNLLNAKVTYFGAVDTLLNSINTAITDGRTTVAEKQAVDTNYSSYKTALASLQSAIEEANKAIQAKLDALSTEKVNNLQIGVENFYHTKSEHVNYDAVLFSKTAKGFEGIGNYNGQYPNSTIRINNIISSNGDWTVKFKAKSNANVPLLCDICDLTVNTFWLSEEFQEFQFTQNVTNYAEGGVYHFIDFVLPSYAWYYIEDLMVVKGNKAPASWIESSKDVQERIDAAKLTAEQAQLAADGYMRARYVRDWTKGSTTDNDNAWGEIKVINKNGNNIAANKLPESNGNLINSTYLTDGQLNTFAYVAGTSPASENYVKIDLGQIYYDIDYIQVWHYYADGRTYYGTKTEISTDGVNWTPVFDSAKSGTYKETALGNIISFRPNEVMAKVLKGAAITDTFKTTINGGLISTVMMLLREFNSLQETAGVSGIQGALKNNPAFWAGGTYAKAFALIEFLSKMSAGTTPSSGEYSNLAKIILLHNGAGKYGDLIIEESGRVVMVNPLTGERRLVFSVNNIPDAYELIDANTGSGSANNTLHTIVYPADEYTLPNTINVTKEGSSISVNANLTLSWDRSGLNTSGYTTFNLILCRNGVDYLYMDNSAEVGSIYGGGPDSDFVTVNQTINDCPSGIYSLRIALYKVTSGDEPRDIEGTISASTLQWSFSQSGTRSLEFGRDGFFALWENMMFHVSQNNGFVLTGKTNMPGVLAKGRVLSGAARDANYAWGAKYSTAGVTKISTGGYRVPVSCPDAYYSVFISPRAASRSYYLGTQTSTYFEVYFTNLSGTAVDTEFDFTVVGKNY